MHPTTELALPNRTESDTEASSAQREIKRLRDDLGMAQRSRGQLEGQFNSLERELKSQVNNLEAARVRHAGLTKSLHHATTKLRDKNEELRGKAKLLEVS